MSRVQFVNHELHAKGQAFLVQIRFRENNCWQGTIQWLEERKTSSFRSLLEMILLINEALEKADTGEGKPGSRSWEASVKASKSKWEDDG